VFNLRFIKTHSFFTLLRGISISGMNRILVMAKFWYNDKQLPPPSHDFIGFSLFSSILRQYETTLLKTEYRFNQDILDLINPNYQYRLKADDSVKDISTADIATRCYNGMNNNLTKILDHENRIVFVDTDGNSTEEKHFINPGEVSLLLPTNNRKECYSFS
jgi:AAA domain-containing protein